MAMITVTDQTEHVTLNNEVELEMKLRENLKRKIANLKMGLNVRLD